jgi:hypothetical protein
MVLFLFYIPSSAWGDETSACQKRVHPLQNKSEQVAQLDGVWGLFQKTAELQDYSAQSISLDNRVNSILFHLEYLCATLDGIPFDELSDYVSTGLAEKGEDRFRKELIILGKSEGEIDVWFEFSRFAVTNRYRTLEPQRVFRTIESAQFFVNGYLELAEKINNKENIGSVMQETQKLIKQIETFFKTDPYMSQAIYENAQVPHADWDEDVGGS